jgi:hypothetical protein
MARGNGPRPLQAEKDKAKMTTRRIHITQDPASWLAGYNAGVGGDSPERSECPPEVPDAFRKRGASERAKAARPRVRQVRKCRRHAALHFLQRGFL